MNRLRRSRQDNDVGFSASLNSAPQPRQHSPVPPSAGSGSSSRPRFGRPNAPQGAGQSLSPAEIRGRHCSNTFDDGHHRHQLNSNTPLPSAWNITDSNLRHSSQLCVTLNAIHNTTVVADRPIPTGILQEAAVNSVASSQPPSGRLNSHGYHGMNMNSDSGNRGNALVVAVMSTILKFKLYLDRCHRHPIAWKYKLVSFVLDLTRSVSRPSPASLLVPQPNSTPRSWTPKPPPR
jgi:hypothetical protein